MRARSAATAALLLGLVLAAPLVAAQQQAVQQDQEAEAEQWEVCGGLNGPNKQDAAGDDCPDGYACVRQDE